MASTDHHRRRSIRVVEVPRLPSKASAHTSSAASIESDNEEHGRGGNRQP